MLSDFSPIQMRKKRRSKSPKKLKQMPLLAPALSEEKPAKAEKKKRGKGAVSIFQKLKKIDDPLEDQAARAKILSQRFGIVDLKP